eukprot:s585_g3.t1
MSGKRPAIRILILLGPQLGGDNPILLQVERVQNCGRQRTLQKHSQQAQPSPAITLPQASTACFAHLRSPPLTFVLTVLCLLTFVLTVLADQLQPYPTARVPSRQCSAKEEHESQQLWQSSPSRKASAKPIIINALSANPEASHGVGADQTPPQAPFNSVESSLGVRFEAV